MKKYILNHIMLVIGLSVISFFLTCSAEFDNPYDPFSSSYRTFTVTYDGNGNTSGSVPIDNAKYGAGIEFVVLGNIGNMLKINVGGASYKFDGWNTQSNGGGVDYVDGQSAKMDDSNIILYAKWTPYILQDTGPAGGLIFYDQGTYSGGWRYMEAAPSDQSTGAQWGCSGTDITGASGTGEGTGMQNTFDIEAECMEEGTAADICANLSVNGYDDWFLPSLNELNAMYNNLAIVNVGNFSDLNYWNSSEVSSTNACYQSFSTSTGGSGVKTSLYAVRAARQF